METPGGNLELLKSEVGPTPLSITRFYQRGLKKADKKENGPISVSSQTPGHLLDPWLTQSWEEENLL